MAHKKAGSATTNGRDSAGRRLGVKKSGGSRVIPGNIERRYGQGPHTVCENRGHCYIQTWFGRQKDCFCYPRIRCKITLPVQNKETVRWTVFLLHMAHKTHFSLFCMSML